MGTCYCSVHTYTGWEGSNGLGEVGPVNFSVRVGKGLEGGREGEREGEREEGRERRLKEKGERVLTAP